MSFGKRFRSHFLSTTFSITILFLAQDANSQDDVTDDNLGVTIQLPTLGVSIDAQGVLATRVFDDVGGKIRQKRIDLTRKDFPQQLQRQTVHRKVSLRRLEQALAERIDAGEPPTNAMGCLAGLTAIEFVFVLPNERDIVIAGPAEPWIENPAGRTVGINTGKPTMLLEDWANAIRTFAPEKKPDAWVACSIDPSVQGLENLRSFQRHLPRQISPSDQHQAAIVFSDQLRNSLGLANVKVYGIEARSNAAHVMIEADYRMKMIAVGLELPPPIRLKTYIDVLTGAPKHLQRWWLTPNYKCLRQTDDALSVQLVGRGVQLQTENISFGHTGRIKQKGKASKLKPSRAARTFALSFTKNYELLAGRRPVFAQLRNVIDCLVSAAWIRANNGYQRVEWRPDVMLDEQKYSLANKAVIKNAQCVANAVWKKNVLILPAGGGVSINAAEALHKSNLIPLEDEGQLQKSASALAIPNGASWWWD